MTKQYATNEAEACDLLLVFVNALFKQETDADRTDFTGEFYGAQEEAGDLLKDLEDRLGIIPLVLTDG